jgi:prevent-host-death family protein
MREIGVLEAKTNLSGLLAEIEASGETVVITRHGRAVARLVPETRQAHRRLTKEALEAHFAWRDEVGRQAEAAGAEPFDWKEAIEDGRE